MTYEEIIVKLKSLANPDKVAFKQKKFGIITTNTLGIYHSDLKVLAKGLRKQNELATQLFDSEIYEARILASKIFDPKDLTAELMEKWVSVFDTWEICDSFSMGIFAKSNLAVCKIIEWSEREKEFEKRAAFATLASYCMADKKADNSVYENFFPLILKSVDDHRIYVKKAVSWALRSLGKRNIDLNKKAIDLAHQIQKIEYKSAQWIAKDVLRELTKENVNILDYPRAIYRPSTS